MGHSERKSAVAAGLGLALVILFLAGCPQQVDNPHVTILREGGQQIGISLALAAGTSVTLQAQSTSSQDLIVWSSTAPDVASVDASGRVTAIAPGTTTILATGSTSLTSASIEIVVSPASSDGEGEGEGEGLDVLVKMTPFSGRFGYGLEGPYGFVGSLTKQELTDPAWRLEGDFSFPTAGYVISSPVVTVAESYPEQVYVAINVIPPSGAAPQVVTHVSITAEIAASNEAQFAIHVITQANPNPGEGEGEGEGQWEPIGETSWIAGETSPPAWTIRPLNPTEADVICLSGPTQVYKNLCHALTTLGQGQLSVDRSSHRIQLTFFPVQTFAACDDARDPVCGIQGSFGPLDKGDWILYAVHANDPVANFNISFHIGSVEPGLDKHVKPIPDDPDGNFLTDAEEQALGDVSGNPDGNGGMPDGIRLAHHLFVRIDQLPICPPPPELDANGTVPGTTPPSDVPLCKTMREANCIEHCTVCGEPYNCSDIAITRQWSTDPMMASGSDVPVELRVSFAALHYMQHGSLSYKWREGGYEGRVDVVALLRMLTPPPPPFEVHWAPGETCPPAWTIDPARPAGRDVIHFSGPTAVYSNACVALTTVGPPQIVVDPNARTVELAFGPSPMMPCTMNYDPVCGLEGAFGPLPEGDWVFFARSEQDALISFKIAFHVGPPGPGPDKHVKAIPDDADGDFLTDGEEQALQRNPQNPDENQNGILDGVELARDLFMRVDGLPECGAQPVADSGDPAVGQIPSAMGSCKTIHLARCTEPCAICGEQYNCGYIEISNPALDQLPFQLSFAALHYMQHGSFGSKWNGQAYAERVDIMRLLMALGPPLGTESVPLCEYLPLAVGNSWEYKPWNSPLTVLYPLEVTGQVLTQNMDLWTLSNNVSIGYVNGFLSAFLAPSAGAKDSPKSAPISLLPERIPIGAPIDIPLLGQVVVHRGPLTAMLKQFCDVTIENFPLGEQPDTIAIVVPNAAGVAGPVFILARGLGLVYCRYPGLNVPSDILPIADALLLNNATIQGNESCPKPPQVVWIADGQCPAQWMIAPPTPTPATPIHFSGPTSTFGNACEATSALGTPRLAIDPVNQRIELMFDPLPGPVPCPMIYAPVCGLKGVFPPLKEGPWLFLCQNPEVSFQLGFTVQGPPPANRVEAQWIPGETGPKEWTMEILPLGMPLNGIRIAGPTAVFGNDCDGRAALGGQPIVCMDENAHALTLMFDGPPPDVCYDLWAPVCGLEARIIGIANGLWTFSAPTLIPPVQLTFTIGGGAAPN